MSRSSAGRPAAFVAQAVLAVEARAALVEDLVAAAALVEDLVAAAALVAVAARAALGHAQTQMGIAPTTPNIATQTTSRKHARRPAVYVAALLLQSRSA